MNTVINGHFGFLRKVVDRLPNGLNFRILICSPFYDADWAKMHRQNNNQIKLLQLNT